MPPLLSLTLHFFSAASQKFYTQLKWHHGYRHSQLSWRLLPLKTPLNQWNSIPKAILGYLFTMLWTHHQELSPLSLFSALKHADCSFWNNLPLDFTHFVLLLWSNLFSGPCCSSLPCQSAILVSAIDLLLVTLCFPPLLSDVNFSRRELGFIFAVVHQNLKLCEEHRQWSTNTRFKKLTSLWDFLKNVFAHKVLTVLKHWKILNRIYILCMQTPYSLRGSALRLNCLFLVNNSILYMDPKYISQKSYSVQKQPSHTEKQCFLYNLKWRPFPNISALL